MSFQTGCPINVLLKVFNSLVDMDIYIAIVYSACLDVTLYIYTYTSM